MPSCAGVDDGAVGSTVIPPQDAVASARNKILTTLESRCEEDAKKNGTPLACEAVTLYQGGQYWLYKYKRYDDVRLAFAPEHAIGAKGHERTCHDVCRQLRARRPSDGSANRALDRCSGASQQSFARVVVEHHITLD